jgi:hypothetical protein
MSPLEQATAALRSKKLRLEWSGPRPPVSTDDALLLAVWKVLRTCWPSPPGLSQDERVTLRLVSGDRVAWEAVFDFDFASSIDKTETRSGELDLRA